MKKLVKSGRRALLPAAFVAGMFMLIGFQTAGVAAQTQRLWSIVIHFQYSDGFEFDYVLERGVPAAELGAALAECGQSHRFGSVVQYHCYAVAE